MQVPPPVPKKTPAWGWIVLAVVCVPCVFCGIGNALTEGTKPTNPDGSAPSAALPNAAPMPEDPVPTPAAAPKPEAPSKPPLEVLSHKAKNEEYARYIVGKVRNNTDHTYAYAQIQASLFNSKGEVVGTALDNVNNLEPGQTWAFKAIILEDDASGYEIKEVTGY